MTGRGSHCGVLVARGCYGRSRTAVRAAQNPRSGHAGNGRGMCRVQLLRLVWMLLLCVAVSGCAVLREFRPAVAVEPLSPGDYIALQRGDILTRGRLSEATAQTLRIAGLPPEACMPAPQQACIEPLAAMAGIDDERRLSALAELWLLQAQGLAAQPGAGSAQAPVQAWLEAARHAYGYLFLTGRAPGDRAFEDRQTQTRDWYNHAVQQVVSGLFDAGVADAAAQDGQGRQQLAYAGWQLTLDSGQVRLPGDEAMPRDLVPASALAFTGMLGIWRRDGFGAELVAVTGPDPVTRTGQGGPGDVAAGDAGGHRPHPGHAPAHAWSEMPSPSLTVLLRFPAQDLAELLATRQATVSIHDPYRDAEVSLHGQRVPLAANFSAGYGLWLADSGFNRQSLRTLFGRADGIEHPHLYLMQPWDPERRVIVMLHGLASSPEAWVNVANEITGDEALRAQFQIWQVYYPTNMPIAYNHAVIRRQLQQVLAHFDPHGTSAAARDMVVIGHSMGGVIARLLVSRSGDTLWDAMADMGDLDPARQARVRERLAPMLRFEPVPQVGRAIFIATPHRGTEVAGNRLAKLLSRLVRLPLTLLEGFGDVLQVLAGGQAGAGDAPRVPNSIDNLDRNDPFMRAAADLPISPRVTYHSIIARARPDGRLEDSNDGLVPYASAHLPGAASETVIESGHSVQQTAQAVLEIRRILHADLAERSAHGAPVP